MSDDAIDRLVTELPNDRSANLDALDTETMLRVLNGEDRSVADAVAAAIPKIATVVDAVAGRLRSGGRLHLFGAGTSGRLALLDAVECPPTFGTPADLVQAHLAGGDGAFVRAVEGAEDDDALGEADVAGAAITTADAVVAVSASGRTPYCLGALRAARRCGAFTVALVCNPNAPMSVAADSAIVCLTGEEVLCGSTRLKAGTAQKMVLNMISTAVMVRLGRTYGNLMVGVQPTNEKLRRRAVRLIEMITQRPEGADAALDAAMGDVRVAVLMLVRKLSAVDARVRLAAADGSLRRALCSSVDSP